MIYLMHNLSQNPKKMADGGMSLLPGQVTGTTAVPITPSTQGSPGPDMNTQQHGYQGNEAGKAVNKGVDQYITGGGTLGGFTQGVGSGFGSIFGGLGKGMAEGSTFQNQYQAQLAPTTQYDYGNVIQGSGANALQGYQEYLNNLAQQQGLAGQIGMQAQGGGPSPSQQLLANTTGENVANQAALMASQRGAGANIGMTQRNAARQGAETQQKAAGQGAALKLQEQLGAQQNLAALYNQIGQQAIQEQGANTSLFGTATGASNAQNANVIRNYEMAQGINSKTASENTAALNKGAQNGLAGLGSMMAMLADGGMAGCDGYANLKENYRKMADGGMMEQNGSMGMGPLADAQLYGTYLNASPDFRDDSKMHGTGPWADSQLYGTALQTPADPNPYARGDGGPQSGVGQFLQGILNTPPKQEQKAGLPGMSMITNLLGGMGGMGGAAHGAIVPGTARQSGDNESNDTVPAMLSPGEIVVPRSAASDPQKAAAFARSVAMRHGKKGKR